MAKDLTEYYANPGLRVRSLRADIETMERTAMVEAIKELKTQIAELRRDDAELRAEMRQTRELLAR